MSSSLVTLIQEKTGISEPQAQQAVDIVVGFLKEKLPEGLGVQLEALAKSENAAVAGQISSAIDGLSGLFGKKG